MKKKVDKSKAKPKSLHECLVMAHGLVEKYIKTKDVKVIEQAHEVLHQGF